MQVQARVRHEPDRSYTVIASGPHGEEEVGTTRLTGDLYQLAKACTARLHQVSEDDVEHGPLHVPQPPYGRDGQIARITDTDEPEDLGQIGIVHWFPPEGSWHVQTAASPGGLYPSEQLDFAPVLEQDEVHRLSERMARIHAGLG